jgi:hypothetical protein
VVIGGAAGVFLAYWGLYGLLKLPQNFVNTEDATLDTRVLLFAFAMSLLTGWVFGLLPALQLAKPDLQSFLKEGGRSSGEARVGIAVRGAFVVAQVALSLLLLVSAGLLIRSFDKLLRVNVGFKPEQLLSLEYRLPRTKYKEVTAQWNFHRQVMDRIQEVPGVQSVALVRGLPFSGNGATTAITLLDREPPAKGLEPEVMFNSATSNYFETMGIPFIKGRQFGNEDRPDTPPVVIINQTMAQRFWPNQDPIGKQIKSVEDGTTLTIVGLVGDAKHYWLEETQRPQMYGAYTQQPGYFATVVIRTTVEPLSLTEPVRQALWKVDADQPMWKIRTVEFLVNRSVADRKFSPGANGNLRFAGAGADDDRALRRHQLSGQPANPGDWNSHGAGRPDARHPADGSEAGNDSGSDRSGAGAGVRLAFNQTYGPVAVSGERDRSADLCGNRRFVNGGCFACLLFAGTSRDEGRSVGGRSGTNDVIADCRLPIGDWQRTRQFKSAIGNRQSKSAMMFMDSLINDIRALRYE